MTSAIDLSELPAPEIVEPLDYEAVLAALKGDLAARAPELGEVLALESEPLVKVLEVAAWYAVLLRARVNDGAKAVMLAHATGGDLDNLAALYGVERALLDAGDPEAVPPEPADFESDAELRRRTQLALEGFSTAGPVGAYRFHALSADGEVRDVSVTSPAPGEVLVTLLGRTGDGTVAPALRARVAAAVGGEDVRPLCDSVTVEGAAILPYTVEAVLHFDAGPDRGVVLAEAERAVAAHVAREHRLGRDITLSGLYAALHRPGVQRVALAAPAAAIEVAETEAAYCTAVTLTDGGLGDG